MGPRRRKPDGKDCVFAAGMVPDGNRAGHWLSIVRRAIPAPAAQPIGCGPFLHAQRAILIENSCWESVIRQECTKSIARAFPNRDTRARKSHKRAYGTSAAYALIQAGGSCSSRPSTFTWRSRAHRYAHMGPNFVATVGMVE